MTLDLIATRKIIQSASLTPKSGNVLAIIEGYKQLEEAGWEVHNIVHPIEHIRIFTRGIANLQHDITLEFDWIVSINDDVYGFDGNIEAITKDVDEMLEEVE